MEEEGGRRGLWRLRGDHGVVCSDAVPGGAAERVHGGNRVLNAHDSYSIRGYQPRHVTGQGPRHTHDGQHNVSLVSCRAIQFAVTKLFGTGSQVPLLLVIDAI
jgi:hypothetical protein